MAALTTIISLNNRRGVMVSRGQKIVNRHVHAVYNITMSTYRAIEAPSLSKSFDEGIQKLRLVTKVRAPLKPNDVRVKVVAAAVNFFDLLMLVGKYQAKPVFPFVPV